MTKQARDFNLQTVTHDVIASRGDWTLDDLVRAVYEATPHGALNVAYRTALHEYVRHQLGQSGSRPGQSARDAQNLPAGAGTASNSRPDHPRIDTQIPNAGAGSTPGTTDHMLGDTQMSAVGGAGQNLARSRVALARAGLRARINVAKGIWRPLIDCSVDDLRYAAAINDRMAHANAAAAERYRRLAKLLEEYKVAKVRDLPPEVLEEVFGNVAA